MTRILVFDSGVGGLTVLGEIRKLLPNAEYLYVADNADFPYGALDDDVLIERVAQIFGHLVDSWAPDVAVIACNTASTLVLPVLRARFTIPFVGTVPAIKPAAEQTKSGLIGVLATPGTIARDYTHELIRSFAAECRVTLVPCRRLAGLAEAKLSGEAVDAPAICDEITLAFIEEDGVRTDTIVLGCTHYPLLLEELTAAAPWPVRWIDPAPAIARRTQELIAENSQKNVTSASGIALFTRTEGMSSGLLKALEGYGLRQIQSFDPSRQFDEFDS